jgi:predicted RNA-binding protein YlxR (DUF448 family)
VRDKSALHRLVVVDGAVTLDPTATAQGRGAYVCDQDCLARAVARRAFGRAFRRAVTVPQNLVDSFGD